MKETILKVKKIQLLGGKLSLNFVNTVDWHASDRPEELLISYTALVVWGRRVNLVSETQASVMVRDAESDPGSAKRILKQAVEFRETLYRILSAISRGNSPGEADLGLLNKKIVQVASRSRLVYEGSGFHRDWVSGEKGWDLILGPVIQDALLLLASNELTRVKECEDGNCGWLFLDTSRNRSRRWCSMDNCGNRAKARRHYLRVKKKPFQDGDSF